MSDLEWDVTKDRANRAKHGVAVNRAQHAFLYPQRVITEDLEHSVSEPCYFCFGRVDDAVHRGVHISKRQDQDFWCRLLAQEKVDL